MSDVFDYDISHYTDEELIGDILELDNPTDRELETKILNNLREYEGLQDFESMNFFENIYDHFFGADETNIIEGMDGYQTTEIRNPDGTLKEQTKDPTSNEYLTMQRLNADIAAKRVRDESTNPNGTITYNANPNTNRRTAGIMDFSSNLTETKTTVDTVSIEYPTGKRNPVQRQTMFKMLSIDSQFRDDYYNTSATSFNMNLSTPITDVISMKLYSVQIPYTWYTINNNFGSNFIFLKGNSPGINNGDHDIQIKIPSGNYDANSLMTAINNRITTLSTGYSTNLSDPYDYRDLSFGQTRVVYDSATVKTRFEFDLKKIYNESDYHMSFPYYTSPQDLVNNVKSIPGFLGFNYQTYDVFTVYSDMKAYGIPDTTNSTFVLDGSNSYFDIIKYQGTGPFTGNSIIETYRINILGINGVSLNTNYSISRLTSFFNNALQSSPFIDPLYSSFSKIDISNNINNVNNSHSHFEIKVKLNNKTTTNIENSKIVVKFPAETQQNAHIWTGTDSCFKFITETNEICEITTETPTLLTNYVIYNDAKINVECIKPNYDVVENTRIAILVASPAEGYLQNDYINAIQNSLTEMNNATKIPIYKPNGEFNNTNTYFNILERAHFQFDINREFDQTSYIVDFSNSILSGNPFFFDNLYSDLSSNNYTISKTITGLSSYTVDNTNNKISVYPKSISNGHTNYGNQNAPIFDTFIPNGTYTTIGSLIDEFNTSFAAVDGDGSAIMASCYFTSQFTSGGLINLSLSFQIKKILTEKDYKVSFVDPSNSWVNYLYMTDPSYHLVNYTNGSEYADIYGSSNFYTNTIIINETNNKIKFTPFINGIADSTDANDIYITVATSSIPYTRQALIDQLNLQTSLTKDPQDPLTSILMGTTFTLITNNQNKQYTKMRLNINKTFRSKDYKLVIYDAESFVYCNVGVTNSLNIRNSTFDSTLGWLLGFHSFTEYDLIDLTTINSDTDKQNNNYSNNVYSNTDLGFSYSYNSSNNKIAIIGDAILNTNLYNYFLVVLDDFVQSHMSDGLITITSLEKDVALPSYAMRAQYICEPIPGSSLTRKVAVSGTSKLNTNLTSKQLYAMNQLYQTRQTRNRSYSAGPSLKDVFAIVPLKLSGVPGGTYVEFGGTLQNQDRKYFGPVRIQKLSIKLMNDKGDIVDLNGADWSITIICEIMTSENKGQ
jgi:hypothetical protein